MKKITLLFLLISSSLFGMEKNIKSEIIRIKSLFEDGLWEVVETEVKSISDIYIDEPLYSELYSYRLMSQILLGRPNVDQGVAEFEKYYQNSANILLIRYYYFIYNFDNQDYDKAAEVAAKISTKKLSKEKQLDFRYKNSFAQLRDKNYNEAKEGFMAIVDDKENKFTPHANYYLGYIYYAQKDFAKAINVLNVASENPLFKESSEYLLLESYFMLKDYTYVVVNGEKLIGKDAKYRSRVARMMSESYFALEMPEKANEYFNIYAEISNEVTKNDYFYSGVVAYTLEAYYPAVDAFLKVVENNDSIAQIAYNYLGNSYLKLKDKYSALDAFGKASNMVYDMVLAEESLFQYAKLRFDLNSDITFFENYLDRYPNSEKEDEIYNYIGSAFLLTNNYKSAISSLVKIEKKGISVIKNLQKACFYRGIQFFESGAYSSALEIWQMGLEYGKYNVSLNALTLFWLSEAFYRTGEIDKAIEINLDLLDIDEFKRSKEYSLALFNIAYSYFSKDNFDQSIIWFERFLDSDGSEMRIISEAMTRLGDSYFMKNNYVKSAQIYEKVAKDSYIVDDIYARYQAALSYGLISNQSKKIELLKTIIEEKPNSPLYSRSVYELGRAYVQIEEYLLAEDSFNQLIKEDELFYAKATLELGMINSNEGRYSEAMSYFEDIVENYPLTEEGENAIAGLEYIYQQKNTPEDFLAYLDKIGKSEVKSENEREVMIFNSAEKIFLTKNYFEAEKSLTSFIKAYPNGEKNAHAYFYLGQTYAELDKPEDAAKAYREVMEKGEGAFVELATLYYGKITYQLQNYDASILAFETLLEVAKLGNNKNEALLWRMRSYYKAAKYEEAVSASEDLLATGNEALTEEINYIKAKSYLFLGRREDAVPLLELLSEDFSSSMGAEAAYLFSLDAYDKGDFDLVEERVYTFSDSGSPQLYWLAKSFIVLGDSFVERDDIEQAEATFLSIQEGYKPENSVDDVLEQVNLRLNKLKLMEVKDSIQ